MVVADISRVRHFDIFSPVLFNDHFEFHVALTALAVSRSSEERC